MRFGIWSSYRILIILWLLESSVSFSFQNEFWLKKISRCHFICNITRHYCWPNGNEGRSRNCFQEFAWSTCIVSHFNVLFSCPGPTNSDAFLLPFSFRFTVQIKTRIIICLLALLFFPLHCVYTRQFSQRRNWISWQEKKMSRVCVCARGRPIQL